MDIVWTLRYLQILSNNNMWIEDIFGQSISRSFVIETLFFNRIVANVFKYFFGPDLFNESVNQAKPRMQWLQTWSIETDWSWPSLKTVIEFGSQSILIIDHSNFYWIRVKNLSVNMNSYSNELCGPWAFDFCYLPLY